MNSVAVNKLLLLSGFCFVLTMFRFWATDTISYVFLPFNLILAWIPLGVAYSFSQTKNQFKLFFLFLLWLVFFPNSPYIITDLIHLKPRNNFPLWFDSVFLYSFAFTGLMLGMFSAILIYRKLKEIFSLTTAKGTMLFAMLLSGYGVYIGRFLRWNSWNILTHPFEILGDTLVRLLHPFEYPRTYGMTLLIGALLFLVFMVFESFMQKEKA